jgi:hypothetical protein
MISGSHKRRGRSTEAVSIVPYLTQHFRLMTAICRGVLDEIKPSIEPQPLDTILVFFGAELDRISPKATESFRALPLPRQSMDKHSEACVGLNTIGLLADRLTILIIKEWCLRHKRKDPVGADALARTQLLDVVVAMANAKPGDSTMNSKITSLHNDAHAQDFPEAFFGLFRTNLMMWESQEILYTREISTLPCEELRSYIKWFSHSNIRRNGYISLCEETFWKALRPDQERSPCESGG